MNSKKRGNKNRKKEGMEKEKCVLAKLPKDILVKMIVEELGVEKQIESLYERNDLIQLSGIYNDLKKKLKDLSSRLIDFEKYYRFNDHSYKFKIDDYDKLTKIKCIRWYKDGILCDEFSIWQGGETYKFTVSFEGIIRNDKDIPSSAADEIVALYKEKVNQIVIYYTHSKV